MFNRPRSKLVYYWSIRYFLLLFIVLMIDLGAYLYMVQHSANRDQQHAMLKMAHDIGQSAAMNGGVMPEEALTILWLEKRATQYGLSYRPVLFIVDKQGRFVQQFPPGPPIDKALIQTKMEQVMKDKPHMVELESVEQQEPFRVAVQPIIVSSQVKGYALFVARKVNILKELLQFKVLRFIAILTLLLTGWIFVYMLTRKLARPIQEAANAAKQVVAGNYHIQLTWEPQEKEVFELIHSFKAMAVRLQQLEKLRTQLLAGVTHELKTPVTSISGLLQAVRDDVVSGQEADKFLEVCQQESNRLQKMIEDLLDFNSFAAGVVNVVFERIDLKLILKEIVDRWSISQELGKLKIEIDEEDTSERWHAMTDPARLEQIMVNLLNNARDAMDGSGTVAIRFRKEANEFQVQVQDTGRGIPEEEQMDVFEPFFRGTGKKARIRGLGIGLPFSRLIARSLGGDLTLTTSIPGMTIFNVHLPNKQS